MVPALAVELQTAPEAQAPQLAQQLPQFQVWEICRCGDEFCASFYAGQRPEGTWAREGAYECVTVDVNGMVNLDVVDGEVRYVEVIHRPDVRLLLGQAFGNE